jgi:hypothetical protein
MTKQEGGVPQSMLLAKPLMAPSSAVFYEPGLG